ncbi:hypothetical protein TSA6c_08940 [Azospirillum sp. TSA6c]|nr:hypothetical protein TSA6c_08940 [Azospirillum sp. TSA6c]
MVCMASNVRLDGSDSRSWAAGLIADHATTRRLRQAADGRFYGQFAQAGTDGVATSLLQHRCPRLTSFGIIQQHGDGIGRCVADHFECISTIMRCPPAKLVHGQMIDKRQMCIRRVLALAPAQYGSMLMVDHRCFLRLRVIVWIG